MRWQLLQLLHELVVLLSVLLNKRLVLLIARLLLLLLLDGLARFFGFLLGAAREFEGNSAVNDLEEQFHSAGALLKFLLRRSIDHKRRTEPEGVAVVGFLICDVDLLNVSLS